MFQLGEKIIRKKIVGIFICIFLTVASLPVIGSINVEIKNKENPKNSEIDTNLFDILDGSWLEEIDGVKVLHLNGSHYEMGYQHGFLLKEECLQNMRAFLNYTIKSVSYERLLEIWDIMKDYIPQGYIDELHGLADGGGGHFEDIAAVYAATECTSLVQCFGFASWGSATVDGKLYHVRSWDLPFNIKDPASGKYVHENSVLILRKPENGFASLCPSVAGALNGAGGFNEEGIGIGAHISWSKDQSFNGPPIIIKIQMVLDYSYTLNEAINVVTSKRSLGWSYIISDSKIPKGVAVETCANHFYVGEWNNSIEKNYPFWQIKDVVRRTNFFIDPILAATQRDRYNPSGLISFIQLIMRSNVFFAVWMNYKANSNEIEKQYGKIDLNLSMSIIQDVYSGKTDCLLAFIKKGATGTSFLKAWNQWVACGDTGDMVVSFATRDKNACEVTPHYFNLFELLNSTPP